MVMAQVYEDLNCITRNLIEEYRKSGLEINIEKTRLRRISRKRWMAYVDEYLMMTGGEVLNIDGTGLK